MLKLRLHYSSSMSYNAGMSRPSTLGRLSPFTEDQWGLITRRQAESAGVSRATLTRLIAEGVLERVGYGVYHLVGSPLPDHAELRAAWLQLAPDAPAWERTLQQGVVSHRSAAALWGLGHLPADRHEFTLPARRQTRQANIRLHAHRLERGEWTVVGGLPVTRPSRIASDLLHDREDPEAVGHLIADAIRAGQADPGVSADALAPHASRFGFHRNDGLAVLRWLLEIVGDPSTAVWLAEAGSRTQGTVMASAGDAG